jgi:hypothetical protein
MLWAADLAVGLQRPLGDSEPSRYHGYYLANGYFAARALDGLEANLNLLLFNPSASDGYRVSSQFGAGLALHAYGNVADLADDPLRIDAFAIDLDRVTLGEGLLVEQIPLEGARAGAQWRDWKLDALVAGRVFWDDDNLFASSVSGFDGLATIGLVGWDKHGERQTNPFQIQAPRSTDEPESTSWYAGASLDVPLSDQLRVAAEYEARLREPIRNGVLARADYLNRSLYGVAVHAGYQFRWYQDGFGPRDALISPSTKFTTPYLEDMYVTNSFEYFGISEFFEQWSHTLMLEGRGRLTRHLELFAELELWLRYAASRASPRFVLYMPSGFRAPGRELSPHYRAGSSVYPWPEQPHRVNLFITNKQVETAAFGSSLFERDRIGSVRRYDPGTYVLLELEVFL